MSSAAAPSGSRAEVLFVEPHSGGRISGGYLYNQRIAAAAPEVRRCAVGLATLERDLAQLDAHEAELVLLDSLFLTPERAAPFARLKSCTGAALGVLLHAFPSFIARGSRREQLQRSLPLQPTPAELRLLEQLDLLVSPGPYADRVLAECGSSIARVVCPPGVDALTAPATARSSEAVLQFISLGSVTQLKGLQDALDALAAMPTRAWRWTIVGSLGVEPQFVSELRRRITGYQLDEHVLLAGEREHAAALAALRSSDVLLISSFTENHPLVALEALAAGVPVAGYAVGGLPDIIAQRETGLLAPLLDVAALSEVCQSFVQDPSERRRLARNALRAASALPSWAEAGRQFVANVRAARARA
jgi:glycosyltransferase involved in cell wall biosynthesis